MDVGTILEQLRAEAEKNPSVLAQLLKTKESEDPAAAFCQLSQKLGYELYEADLVFAGEEMYAQMKRSVNGGGDTDPMLQGEDDYYEQFIADLKKIAQKQKH